MSQKAILVRVEGDLVPEVFHSVPDYEEMCQICTDNGWDGTEEHISDSYHVEYEWLDIGEGESGLDSFIDDETLLNLYERRDFEHVLLSKYELHVEVIESGNEVVLIEDL